MEGLYEKNGTSLKGRALKDVSALLHQLGLRCESNLDFTTALYNPNNRLVATGSLLGSIVKCVAVDPEYQGQGLLAQILTILFKEASSRGINHLFLYTKPKNQQLFGPLGFYPIVETPEVLLMENLKKGIDHYLENLKAETGNQKGKTVGAIVANCNPFTRGHRYLMEEAAKKCDLLHLFILTDGKVPENQRLAMVREGTKDIKNLVLHTTGDYLVSQVTFPDYFIKDKIKEAWYDLDIAVFCQRIAPTLGINCRFVGTEPNCVVTNGYNEALKLALPKAGIIVVEMERLWFNGMPISASRVRQYLAENNIEGAKALVLPQNWDVIKEIYG